MSLYREVKRQAGVPVTIALWKHGDGDDIRQLRESAGQCAGEYSDLNLVPVGEDMEKGRALLEKHKGNGAVHVFCVYQVSRVWRQLIKEARESGARVVVYAEAPCEMCVGVEAILKRLYYRFVLPRKIGWVAKHVDLFLCQSGEMGVDRLLRIGWRKEQIVPFGYASDFNFEGKVGDKSWSGRKDVSLRVLHTGIETPYRDVGTLRRAVDFLRGKGIAIDLACTGGKASDEEMARLYGWADVFVACGLCEPWGMRVNDAIHAGLPVVVSDGMGASWLVDRFGCGCVYPAGDADALSSVLERFAVDGGFRARLKSGVSAAHEAWSPEARAKFWLDEVLRS